MFSFAMTSGLASESDKFKTIITLLPAAPAAPAAPVLLRVLLRILRKNFEVKILRYRTLQKFHFQTWTYVSCLLTAYYEFLPTDCCPDEILFYLSDRGYGLIVQAMCLTQRGPGSSGQAQDITHHSSGQAQDITHHSAGTGHHSGALSRLNYWAVLAPPSLIGAVLC